MKSPWHRAASHNSFLVTPHVYMLRVLHTYAHSHSHTHTHTYTHIHTQRHTHDHWGFYFMGNYSLVGIKRWFLKMIFMKCMRNLAIHRFCVYKRHVRWEGTYQRHKSTCDILMLLNSTKNSPVADGWNPHLLANWIGNKTFQEVVYVYVSMYMYAYIYAYIYIHIWLHLHTHSCVSLCLSRVVSFSLKGQVCKICLFIWCSDSSERWAQVDTSVAIWQPTDTSVHSTLSYSKLDKLTSFVTTLLMTRLLM